VFRRSHSGANIYCEWYLVDRIPLSRDSISDSSDKKRESSQFAKKKWNGKNGVV